MGKEILISIRPEFVEKILNGEKTIEIRKTMPKCELPCKVYIYCTKQSLKTGKYVYVNEPKIREKAGVANHWCDYKTDKIIINEGFPYYAYETYLGKGKIVAEFTLNKVDWLIDVGGGIHFADKDYNLKVPNELLKKSCLKEEDIYNYLGRKKDNKAFFNDGYAWYIDDLKIYDTPKELSEFRKDLDCDDYPCNKSIGCEHSYFDRAEGCSACRIDFDGEHCIYKIIKRPPQSWCYVEKV